MDDLYTRGGRLLQRSGNHLHSRSGRYLGQLQNGKVFDPDGRYSGTIVGDRVVYRTIDSAAKIAASTAVKCAPVTHADRTAVTIWGVEPRFAD